MSLIFHYMFPLEKIRSDNSPSRLAALAALCLLTLAIPSCATRGVNGPERIGAPPPHRKAAEKQRIEKRKKNSKLTAKEKKALRDADLWVPE